MLIKILIVISFLLISPCTSFATVYFQTGWETGTPSSCWPCKTLGTCVFDGWNQPDYIDGDFWQLDGGTVSTRSNTQAHSGTYSYYQYRKAGEAGTCDIMHEFDTPYPTTIYIRFYLYLDTGWTTTYVNRSDFLVHLLFTNTAAGSTGFRLNLTANGQWGDCPTNQLCMLPEGDGGEQWWDTRASCSPSGNWTAGTNFLTLVGGWHAFEYKMQISGSNVILTEWIDGTQTRGPCTGPGQNTSSFNKIIISGWDNLSTNIATGFYIDDLVIADSYIGLTTSSSAPTLSGATISGGSVY